MHWAQENSVVTLCWDAPARADADSATVELLNGSGSAVLAAGTEADPGLDSVDTTLTQAAAAGSETLRVTSATGIVAGRKYLVTADGYPSEQVSVRSFSGTTVRLKYPTAYHHPDGSALQSTRLSHTIEADTLTPVSDYWRLRFTYEVDGVVQPPGELLFGVSKHYPHNPINPLSLREIDPLLMLRFPSDLIDWEDLRESAWDEVCQRIQQTGVALADYVGTDRVKLPALYMALYRIAELDPQSREREIERLRLRVDQLIQQFIGSTPVDENRDDKIDAHERSGHSSMRIVRSR